MRLIDQHTLNSLKSQFTLAVYVFLSTVDYVEDLKKLLFSMPLEDMKKTFKKYKKKVPNQPLAAQFDSRLGRKDAIKKQANRKKLVTKLFPEGTVLYKVQCFSLI